MSNDNTISCDLYNSFGHFKTLGSNKHGIIVPVSFTMAEWEFQDWLDLQIDRRFRVRQIYR
jgi:hypothetical protein